MKITDFFRYAFDAVLLFFVWRGDPFATKLCLTLALISIELIVWLINDLVKALKQIKEISEYDR